MQAPRILVIEDTASMAALYVSYLQNAGYEAESAGDGPAGLALMQKQSYQAVVLDLHLPGMNGMEVLNELRQASENVPVIIVTAYGSIDSAVEAMKRGAFDFIVKPFPAARLNTTVQMALDHGKMERELTELRRDLFQEIFQRDFIGASPAMQAVFRQIDAVASSRASLFISGETGTGKRMTGRALHRASPRKNRPFIVFDCAATPREEMESALFGKAAGPGAIELANMGTLFLSEVCDLPSEIQARLMQYMQDGCYTAKGATEQKTADIRLISATSRSIQNEVAQGRFREDLFYRLHVVPFDLPPLRERENDVVLIARHFLLRYATQEKKNFAGFEPEVLSLLLQYEWPGNVRQLESLVHQIVALHDGPLVTTDMLPESITDFPARRSPALGFTPFLVKPLWQIEKETIMKALEASHNDVPRAASILEVSPSTIYRKLQAWNTLSGPMQKALDQIP